MRHLVNGRKLDSNIVPRIYHIPRTSAVERFRVKVKVEILLYYVENFLTNQLVKEF